MASISIMQIHVAQSRRKTAIQSNSDFSAHCKSNAHKQLATQTCPQTTYNNLQSQLHEALPTKLDLFLASFISTWTDSSWAFAWISGNIISEWILKKRNYENQRLVTFLSLSLALAYKSCVYFRANLLWKSILETPVQRNEYLAVLSVTM